MDGPGFHSGSTVARCCAQPPYRAGLT